MIEIKNSNPLLCDIETGMCEIDDAPVKLEDTSIAAADKLVKIIYFTDPICSSCWGIEPQLRKLKLEYGEYMQVEYRMGGLLPDWNYNSGGISKPSDVAPHWDEVSEHYDMPIDGDVWLEDPLHSSYPPSIAFKAAQLQDQSKALDLLRELREMVFLKKINIAKWENLAVAAKTVGLDMEAFERDFNGNAEALFKEDLNFAASLGVRGFPTMFFADQEGNQEKVYGTKPYSVYESALLKQLPDAVKKHIDPKWENLFGKYKTLTSKEFSELSQTPRNETDAILQKLVDEGNLTKLVSKNGVLWMR
jgi:putative protein-disulfide isomerase